MKTKLSYSILFLLIATLISAQVTIGVQGGVNFQNLNGKSANGDALENSMIPGFNAGINIQIPIAPEFYFQPGILYNTKGAKHQGTLLTTTTTLSYIELPLNFVYKGSLGSGFVLLGVGPYVAYGINGKELTEGGSISLETPVKFQNRVELSDSPFVPYYNALDAGGTLFVGYELAGGIYAQLNAQLGMLDIHPEYAISINDKSVLKNTGFGVSLGYRF